MIERGDEEELHHTFEESPWPEAVPHKPFLMLLRFNRPYLRRYAMGSALAVIFVIISLVLPLVVRNVVAGLADGSITLTRLCICFIILMTASMATGIARYFQRIWMIGASRHVEYDLRNAYFRRLQRLSASFFNRTPTGDILARATSDMNHVRDFIGPGVMGTVDMIRVPITLGMMIYFSWRLTLIALIPLPALTILVYLFVRFMNRQSRIVQDLYSEVSTRVQENIAGARVVKAFGIEDREDERFREVSIAYMRANIKLSTVTSFAWPFIDLLVGLALLLIIWKGGSFVIEGKMAIGDLTAFMITVAMMAWPLIQFGWVLTLYQRGSVSMNRISEILVEVPEIEDNEQTGDHRTIGNGAIRFNEVTFRYPSSRSSTEDSQEYPPALAKLSFEIPAGTTLALVGPTGSGKSTLLSLLCREYRPDEGEIRIEDIPLYQYPLRTLYRHIACVPQDTFIFSDSIRENIRLGLPEASDEAILNACAVAGFLADLNEMPEGLDTLLGERGVNLSGGQKQRLAIARAILCEPTILLLDDALSSVDTRTEESILRELRRFMASRTSIIVSHRISTIRHADKIIVLDHGRILEEGHHDDLIRLNGLYARMYRRQLLETRLEETS